MERGGYKTVLLENSSWVWICVHIQLTPVAGGHSSNLIEIVLKIQKLTNRCLCKAQTFACPLAARNWSLFRILISDLAIYDEKTETWHFLFFPALQSLQMAKDIDHVLAHSSSMELRMASMVIFSSILSTEQFCIVDLTEWLSQDHPLIFMAEWGFNPSSPILSATLLLMWGKNYM